MLRTNSIVEVVRRITELLLRSLRVSGRRVEVFMAENLSQTHQVILVVGQKLVRHRVPQEMRMNLEAAER